jgi:hypothetical protein
MFAALFVSLLLLGTPVQSLQDSVSAQRVEKLESRIAELEKQVLEYRAREDYFQSILASQRWTFGTVVGLFAALVSLVGFGVFRRYLNEVERYKNEMEARVKKIEEDFGEFTDKYYRSLAAIKSQAALVASKDGRHIDLVKNRLDAVLYLSSIEDKDSENNIVALRAESSSLLDAIRRYNDESSKTTAGEGVLNTWKDKIKRAIENSRGEVRDILIKAYNEINDDSAFDIVQVRSEGEE